jgi:hypothetical protein
VADILDSDLCYCSRRAILLSGLALAACGGHSDLPVVQTVNTNDYGSIFRSVAIQLDRAAHVEVEYQPANSTRRLRVRSSGAASTTHEIVLPRLRAQTNYLYRLRVNPDSNYTFSDRDYSFTTGALPDDLAAMTFTSVGTLSTPLLFLSVRSIYTGGVVVDQEGQVVWYGRTNGAPQGAYRRASGNWIMVSGYGLEEFDALGRVTASLAHSQLPAPHGDIHHGVVETADRKILFIASDPRDINGQVIYGEALWLWAGDAAQPVKVWNAFDFLDPTIYSGSRSISTDWFHANHVSVGATGNIYVSFHYLDKVISIASDFESLQWQLGGINSTFTLAPDQIFSGQHSVREVASGRILLFDNGFARVDGSRWSRLMEFELDLPRSSARKAWEYRPSPDIWATVISSVRRLPNGNTLGTFGTPAGVRGSTGPISVHEVSPSGVLLGSLTIDGPTLTTVFQGDPMNDVGGELVLA